MLKRVWFVLVMFGCVVQANADSDIALFTGNANRDLAQKVADYLNIPLGKATVTTFNDGEIQIHVEENVHGKDVFVIQPGCRGESQSVNDHLMELFLLVRTMKRSSAESITAVIPYYGYARQDRKTASRVPISAADMALMLETAGIDRAITIDLHCGQIQGFFRDVPVDNLTALPFFVPYLVDKKLHNIVIVSPDAGGVDRANKFAEALRRRGVETKMALISKERARAGVVSSMRLIGDVAGADAIIVDDLCDTGGTLIHAAQLLKKNGANKVFSLVTHPVFSGSALDTISKSAIDEMIVADTIPLRGNIPTNVHVISVAPLIGEAILRVHEGKSIAELFEESGRGTSPVAGGISDKPNESQKP